MLTLANIFVKFQCFHKRITRSMFPLQKKNTPINTTYKCQKKEKVELEISM